MKLSHFTHTKVKRGNMDMTSVKRFIYGAILCLDASSALQLVDALMAAGRINGDIYISTDSQCFDMKFLLHSLSFIPVWITTETATRSTLQSGL